MKEASVGGSFAAVFFRIALIALVVWLALWAVAIALLVWVIYHVLATHPPAGTRQDEPRERTNWFAVAAALLAAALIIPFVTVGYMGWAVFVLGAGTLVAAFLSLAAEVRSLPTRWATTGAAAAAAVTMLLVGVNLWADRPQPMVADEDLVAVGTASTVEDVWADRMCTAGSEDRSPADVPVATPDGYPVSSCTLPGAQSPTFFVQAQSPDDAARTLREGLLGASSDYKRDADVYLEGAVVIVTADEPSSDLLRDLGFDRVWVD